MPSTPSSSSTFSPSLSHNPSTSPSPSSPSIGIPSRDANSIATHDLPLPAPSVPISSACAACKYQRRKCGPQCMLAPYFPPERQHDFQNAHKLFGVSNIVKKLRKLSPPERQNAVDSMVFEANIRAADPSGGCLRLITQLKDMLERLHEELTYTRGQIDIYRAGQCNFETNPHDQSYPDQSQASFVSLDDINPSQNKLQNQAQEQRLHDYFYFDDNQTDMKNNNNSTDIGSHDISCNYVNNDYNHNYNAAEQEEQDRDEIRPFMDILPICSDDEEEEEQLVCKSSVDMTSLNSALDTSTQCSLGLGFSDF